MAFKIVNFKVALLLTATIGKGLVNLAKYYDAVS